MICIETDILRVMIDEFGAQMSSIYHKKEKIEYLWQRDPQYWSSSSPVVFPVIGKLNGLKMCHEGREYTMKSNGLIRYTRLAVEEQKKDSVTFLFKNENKEIFPFLCSVRLTYSLQANRLEVSAQITNESEESEMYYFYAGHPGFNIPMFEKENPNDYYIEFEKNESINVYDVCESGQLMNQTLPFFENEKRFFIRKDLFLKEALVFDHPKSDYLFIKSLNHSHQIRVNFSEFDNIAVWSPYRKDKDLKFVCIEPWIGHTEFKNYNGEWKNHDGIACLHPKKSKTYKFSIDLS